MEKFKKMLPYLAVLIFDFYLLPFLIKDTGSGMLILLIGIPMICFMVSLIYGVKNSFNWLFPLLTMLLFAPSIFIFYNESAAIYILAYGIISLIGNFLGKMFRNKKGEQIWKNLRFIITLLFIVLLYYCFKCPH